MSLMAVLIIFSAMAVFSGLLIAVATARSAQITRELEQFSPEVQEVADESYTVPRTVVPVTPS